MKLAVLTIFSMVAILLILTQGCGGISNADQIVFPTSGVSYSQQVEPFFTLACNTAGCHNATDMADGVDLSSYSSIISGLSGGLVVVDKANPNIDTSSILILTLFGEEPHTAPLDVNENQRVGIKTWIMEGALLN
jgi:hypothetical protein